MAGGSDASVSWEIDTLCAAAQSGDWATAAPLLTRYTAETQRSKEHRQQLGLRLVSGAARQLDAASIGGPGHREVVLGLTGLCRLLRNCCAEQPDVRRALLDGGLLPMVVSLISWSLQAETCEQAVSEAEANASRTAPAEGEMGVVSTEATAVDRDQAVSMSSGTGRVRLEATCSVSTNDKQFGLPKPPVRGTTATLAVNREADTERSVPSEHELLSCALAASQLLANAAVNQQEAQNCVWWHLPRLLLDALRAPRPLSKEENARRFLRVLSTLLAVVYNVCHHSDRRLAALLAVGPGGASSPRDPGSCGAQPYEGAAPLDVEEDAADESVGQLSDAERLGWLWCTTLVAEAAEADTTSCDNSWALLLVQSLVLSGRLGSLLEAAKRLDLASLSLHAAAPSLQRGVLLPVLHAVESILEGGTRRIRAARASLDGISTALLPLLECARTPEWWERTALAEGGGDRTDRRSSKQLSKAPFRDGEQLLCLLRCASALVLAGGLDATPGGTDCDCDAGRWVETVVPALVRVLRDMELWHPARALGAAKQRRASGASNNGGDAVFAAAPSGVLASDPSPDTLGTEGEIVRLLALTCHRRPAVQACVREVGGLPVVLQRCQLDDDNPFVREWALLAVRNLCEGSPENQAWIAAMDQVPKGVANPEVLDGTGLQAAVNPATSRVQVRQQRRGDIAEDIGPERANRASQCAPPAPADEARGELV